MNKNESATQELRNSLSLLSTANLSDAMQGTGTLADIHAIGHELKLVGPAITVQTRSGAWADVTRSIDLAQNGEVLVVDAGGLGPAVWGELATHSALQRKLAGVVINGAARDVEEIRKLGFPLYCRLVVPNAGRPKQTGEIGKTIRISSVKISPGDWIIGDSSGVVCIPKEKVYVTVENAMKIMERENTIRGKIEQGSTLWQEMGLYWVE